MDDRKARLAALAYFYAREHGLLKAGVDGIDFAWEKREAPRSKFGYKWFDTDTGRTRYQQNEPGKGRGKKAEDEPARKPARPKTPKEPEPVSVLPAERRKPIKAPASLEHNKHIARLIDEVESGSGDWVGTLDDLLDRAKKDELKELAEHYGAKVLTSDTKGRILVRLEDAIERHQKARKYADKERLDHVKRVEQGTGIGFIDRVVAHLGATGQYAQARKHALEQVAAGRAKEGDVRLLQNTHNALLRELQDDALAYYEKGVLKPAVTNALQVLKEGGHGEVRPREFFEMVLDAKPKNYANVLHREDQKSKKAASPPPEPAAGKNDADTLAETVDAMDKESGKHNLVPLTRLRKKLGWSRERFDRAVHAARKAGHLSASAYEGRHGITAEDREASIREGEEMLGYLSRRK